jgi:hypothetical protein
MNKKQRIILAIFIPIIILFITLVIANSVGYTAKTRTIPKNSFLRKYVGMYHEGNPFDWKRTWHIWFLSLTFCCIFEYKLFADKKDKKEIKNKGG